MPTMNGLKEIAHRVMRERGLSPDFSPAVLAETSAMVQAPAAQGPAVRDLRGSLWASIDNDTSRDLDQLSVCQPTTGGAVKILVAVADVDASVRPGSAIYAHARTNTTSVYTAAEIFPMLPERLSTDLTSLGEGQDRLAIVIEMDVQADGTVQKSDVYRAAVRNHAKLAYNSVAAWLEGTAPMPSRVAEVSGLEAQLRIQDQVAQSLRANRRQRGALSLQTPQAEAVFEGGQLSDLRPEPPNRAKELIEDLMVAANGVAARTLAERGFPSLRRVLRSPERWERIVALAGALGQTLPPQANGEALARFLDQRRREDPVRFPDLSLSVVKLLGRGEYELELPGDRSQGHFGLAVSDYTHSTAPNRRFADIVTQRLIKAVLSGQPAPYSDDELTAIATNCTVKGDAARKVEREMSKRIAALAMSGKIGTTYDAIVTGVTPRGTFVRVLQPHIEGLLTQAQGLDVGDRVRVKLTRTDVQRGFIDFARA